MKEAICTFIPDPMAMQATISKLCLHSENKQTAINHLCEWPQCVEMILYKIS